MTASIKRTWAYYKLSTTHFENSVPLGCTVITLASANISISLVFVYWLAASTQENTHFLQKHRTENILNIHVTVTLSSVLTFTYRKGINEMTPWELVKLLAVSSSFPQTGLNWFQGRTSSVSVVFLLHIHYMFWVKHRCFNCLIGIELIMFYSNQNTCVCPPKKHGRCRTTIATHYMSK